MGEHKQPKQTTRVTLTLMERLTLYGAIRHVPPSDRDNERAWMKVWDVLDFDGAAAEGTTTTTDDGRTVTTFPTAKLNGKGKGFELTEADVNTLLKLPVAKTVELARLIAPVLAKLEKAKEALK